MVAAVVNASPEQEMLPPLLLVLLGPTASGKTALSLALAEAFDGEIVNCDSVAVYRELEIGTAKPSLAERQRAPHHLLDVVDPTQPYTAGDYSRDARAALEQIQKPGHLPIVVGGTGLYLRALVDGLFPGPQRSEELRERLRAAEAKYGTGHLHKVLRRIDAAAAGSIHANDLPKLVRAIEICIASKQPLTEAWKQGRVPLQGFRVLRIGLEPERRLLYDRINQRAAAMFAHGLVEETQALVARYGYECRPLTSLGYKQACELLRGEVTQPEAIASAQQGHRNYAKRQFTWFRREPEVHWLRGFGDQQAVVQQAMQIVRAAL
jgi:tRNA dimethylallyltransferase